MSQNTATTTQSSMCKHMAGLYVSAAKKAVARPKKGKATDVCPCCGGNITKAILERGEPICGLCTRSIVTLVARNEPENKGVCCAGCISKTEPFGTYACEKKAANGTVWCKIHGADKIEPSALDKHMSKHKATIMVYMANVGEDASSDDATSSISEIP